MGKRMGQKLGAGTDSCALIAHLVRRTQAQAWQRRSKILVELESKKGGPQT